MECPHCGIGIHEDFTENFINTFNNNNKASNMTFTHYTALSMTCPECHEVIIFLEVGQATILGGKLSYSNRNKNVKILVFPNNRKKKVSNLVPKKYAKEYKEAFEILEISPKSSATLCRRLLQMILHDEFKIKKKNLDLEIQEYETKHGVSSEFIELLQLLRKVGNLGAHPQKSENASEIVEVEKIEAEISLKTIEMLFDEVFTKPKLRRKDINLLKEKYDSKENLSQGEKNEQ